MRFPVMLLVVAALVSAAAPASAFQTKGGPPKPRLGTWHGTTSQGLPVSFKVILKRYARREDEYYFKRVSIKVNLTCEDQSVITKTFAFDPGISLGTMIGRGSDTRFRMAQWWPIGGRQVWIAFQGTFPKTRRAQGGLNVQIRGTSAGTCSTNDYTFKARI